MAIELVYDPVATHQALRRHLQERTVPVNLPEMDPELPDDGLPDELDEDDYEDEDE